MYSLLTAEDREFKAHCDHYAQTELISLARELGEVNEVPQALKESLAKAGVYGPLFPREYGGTGVSSVRICLAREALAGVYSPADTTLAMQGLGGLPIVLAGTEAQKTEFLPPLASGQRLATFALTEPEAGSDASAIRTTAEAKGDGFVINGRKRFISNGYSADVAVVFAGTPTSENPRGLSAFLVELGTKGCEVAWRIELMASHDIVEFHFQDLEVGREALLGQLGGGFKLAMQTLDLMRMTVGAAALGMARAAQGVALRHAKERVQFGKPIAAFQGVAFKLAEMATEIQAAHGLVYLAAIKRDGGDQDASVLSSMAKLYATEAAFRCIDQAVQIHGGLGVVKGSAVERLYREIRPLRIYEGTSEIQKLIIANRLIKEGKSHGSGAD
jgi:alkylation response protein AidB-like acyl-CoA dehydrogenase